MGKENVDMKKHDFFDHDFNDSDFIYCFGIDFIMERLLNKCKEEMNDVTIFNIVRYFAVLTWHILLRQIYKCPLFLAMFVGLMKKNGHLFFVK